MSEWISVEDKLPNHSNTVLIMSDGSLFLGRLMYYGNKIDHCWIDNQNNILFFVTDWLDIPSTCI